MLRDAVASLRAVGTLFRVLFFREFAHLNERFTQFEDLFAHLKE